MNSGKTVATGPTGFLVPTAPNSRKAGLESRNPVCGVNSKPLCQEKDHATRIPFRFPLPSLRSDYPLSDDQIHRVAPSIFADAPHESRSQRYAYIPTAAVLTELRKEGFQPFMVTQTRVRDEGKREHTKHMIRLRHASQINGAEANEIVLLNSHDGTSSYQMLAGMFRFVCSNGLVCGNTVADVRVPHKGDVAGLVIEGLTKS